LPSELKEEFHEIISADMKGDTGSSNSSETVLSRQRPETQINYKLMSFFTFT